MKTYDAVLLVSFGGPEGPDDVIPFLENVTRGRGIPRERLAAVGEHYMLFGGVSPINGQNRDLLEALRRDFGEHGVDVPVYWGNRNWDPYLRDALAQMRDDGVRRALCVVTSAYASYSGCRQYREDLAAATAEVPGAPALDKVRHYFNHPGFVAPTVDAVVDSLAALPEGAREGAAIAFTTHSIPTGMAAAAGPEGGAYERQHRAVAEVVAAEVARRTGRAHRWDLVYCSRSGPPTQPWLEPDVNDHLEALHGEGVPGVVVAPIGFVSDHMEVVYDLDTEARETAERLGLPYQRAATVGTDPRFVAALRELVVERDEAEAGARPARPAVGALPPSHDVCPVGCCRNLRGPRPALCGRD
ncbi:ferrochelatase [Vallicoccus soli]|uniref:Coproporphyrin III ferrochelatase n=1 Tax=Vallicoccus soli TaxID=2339232 RepID=A0A3A3YX93_9ACTN|nr:ferrochelatase [Vallicoccus soli]RJK96268.1 ferrochelatase [Vallicoccus soli]